MRNRLCIIILLVVWIVEPFACVSNGTLRLSVSWWAVWRSTENLAELVVYQVSRLMPWPPPGTHSHRRSQQSGGPHSRRLDSPSVDGDEKEDEEPRSTKRPQRKEEFGSISLFDPQRWGLSPDLSWELPECLHGFWQRYYECFRPEPATPECMPTIM